MLLGPKVLEGRRSTWWSKNSPSDDSSSESDDSSRDEIEAAVRALAEERVCMPPRSYRRNNRVKPRLLVLDRDQQLMDTAREILRFHVPLQLPTLFAVFSQWALLTPLSHESKWKPLSLLTFLSEKTTVCPHARVPRRWRKGKVAPERTLEDVKEKMRAPEERKLEELQRIQGCARSRAGVRTHSVETSNQAIASKIAAKGCFSLRQSRSRSPNQKRGTIRSSENQTNRVGCRTPILLTTLSLTIQWKLDCRRVGSRSEE